MAVHGDEGVSYPETSPTEEAARGYEQQERVLHSPPTKPLMVLGAIGAIIVAAGSIVYIVTGATSGYSYYYWGDVYPIFVVIAAIILFVGVFIHSFAYLSFYANHRSPMGLATFIFAVIASVMFLVFVILSIELQDYFYSGPRYVLNPLYSFTGVTFLGLGFIVMGSCLIAERKQFRTHPMFLTTGILQIISGSFIMSYVFVFFVPVGWALLFVSSIFTTIAFFTTVPTIGRLPTARAIAYGAEGGTAQPREGPISLRFCQNCGRRTEGTPYCGYCGEKFAQ